MASGVPYQFVVWRASFLNYQPGTPAAPAYSGPVFVSITMPGSPAVYWWDYATGTFLGASPGVTQSYDPFVSGFWFAKDEVYVFSAEGQLVAAKEVEATPVTGPYAYPGTSRCYF